MPEFKLGKDSDRTDFCDVILNLDYKRVWRVTIKQWREKRSNAQLAYFYAGIVHPVCEITGNDQQDIHDFICGEYWGWESRKIMGQVKKKPIRTLTSPEPATVEEMVNLCEWAVMRFSHEGIVLEPPKEIQM